MFIRIGRGDLHVDLFDLHIKQHRISLGEINQFGAGGIAIVIGQITAAVAIQIGVDQGFARPVAVKGVVARDLHQDLHFVGIVVGNKGFCLGHFLPLAGGF